MQKFLNTQNVGIIGLGPVGLVTGVGLALKGKKVVGYDIDSNKRKLLSQGKSPFFEPGLEEALNQIRDRFRVASSLEDLIDETKIYLICVGTPSKEDGRVNLEYVFRAVESLIKNLCQKGSDFFLLVLRSTVPPGTGRNIIKFIEKNSPFKCGKNFGYVHFPEFLREGTALDDFLNPHKIIFGPSDHVSEINFLELIEDFIAPCFNVLIDEAELIKYLDNVWHALKVSFANEILRLSSKWEIDAWKIMHIFCQDTKLNISSIYLRPGMPFGGSCLPKDLKALIAEIEFVENFEEIPLIRSIEISNKRHLQKINDWIIEVCFKYKLTKLLLVGLAFKPATDDCRESVGVKLAENLASLGYELKVFDPLVDYNKVKQTFPDISHLNPSHWVSSLEEGILWADIVIMTGSFWKEDLFFQDKLILDINGISKKYPFSGKVLCPFATS